MVPPGGPGFPPTDMTCGCLGKKESPVDGEGREKGFGDCEACDGWKFWEENCGCWG